MGLTEFFLCIALERFIYLGFLKVASFDKGGEAVRLGEEIIDWLWIVKLKDFCSTVEIGIIEVCPSLITGTAGIGSIIEVVGILDIGSLLEVGGTIDIGSVLEVWGIIIDICSTNEVGELISVCCSFIGIGWITGVGINDGLSWDI